MKVKLIISRATMHGIQEAGSEIDVPPGEAIRLIKAGQAVAVRKVTSEKAIRRKQSEKAVR